jgi:hypothetical protein
MEASEPIYYPPPSPPSSFLEWNLLFNDPRDKFRDHSFLIKKNRVENFRNRGVLTLKKQTINLGQFAIFTEVNESAAFFP